MASAVLAPLVAGTVVHVTFFRGLSSAEEVSDVAESADVLLVGGTTIVDKAGVLRLLDKPSRGEVGKRGGGMEMAHAALSKAFSLAALRLRQSGKSLWSSSMKCRDKEDDCGLGLISVLEVVDVAGRGFNSIGASREEAEDDVKVVGDGGNVAMAL
jgi:hypothetical protein